MLYSANQWYACHVKINSMEDFIFSSFELQEGIGIQIVANLNGNIFAFNHSLKHSHCLCKIFDFGDVKA